MLLPLPNLGFSRPIVSESSLEVPFYAINAESGTRVTLHLFVC
jgi:hypothetical protein